MDTLKSPFASRLRTNFIPNDLETLMINGFIRHETAQLPELRQEVLRAKEVYDGLVVKYSQYLEFIEDHQKLVRPLRRGIPDDILQEIFLQCLPTDGYAVLHPKKAPLVLTNVCPTWRRVASSTPRLWASLYIPMFNQVKWSPNLKSKHPSPPENVEELLKHRGVIVRRCMSFARALTVQLSLPLPVTSGYKTLTFPQENQLFMDLISSKQRSLTTLKIDVDFERLTALSLDRSVSFVLLEEADITAKHMGTPSQLAASAASTAWSISPLFRAPQLRKLSISNLHENIPALPLPWKQLTSLKLHETDGPLRMRGLVRLLKPCSQLIHLSIVPNPTITLEYPEDRSEDPVQAVSLFALKTFQLDLVLPLRRGPAFASFHIPNLEDVTLLWAGRINSPLLSLVRRCNLRSLKTAGSLFKDNELIECLWLCQNLEVLILVDAPEESIDEIRFSPSGIDKTDSFLRMLWRLDEYNTLLCPRLEHFESTTREDNAYTDEAVLDFIKAKQSNDNGLSKLRYIAIVFDRLQESLGDKELEPYIKDGLKCELTYANLKSLDRDYPGTFSRIANDLAHHIGGDGLRTPLW